MPVVINKLNDSVMKEYIDEGNYFNTTILLILIFSISINIYYIEKYNKLFSNFYKKLLNKYL